MATAGQVAKYDYQIHGGTDVAPWMRMYVPESQFVSVIDMLRNEAPVFVYYASGSGFLHTGKEPIGEGE